MWTRSRRLAVDSGRLGFRDRRAESGEESWEGWELQHLLLPDVQEMGSWRQKIRYQMPYLIWRSVRPSLEVTSSTV